MTVFVRYLAFGAFLRTVVALALLLTIYALFDVVELGALSHLSTGELIQAYLLKIPAVLSQMLPVALVIGIALEVATLKRRGELEALGAMGISPVVIACCLLTLPALFTVAAHSLSGYAAPASLRKALPPVSAKKSAVRWVKDGDRLVRIDAARYVVTSLRFAAPGRPAERYDRSGAGGSRHWKRWRLDGGWKYAGVSAPRRPNLDALSATAAPLGALPGATLSNGELDTVIRRRAAMGLDNAPLHAEKGLRRAMTAAVFLIPFVTLWFQLNRSTQSPARHVAEGIALCAVYWLITAVLWNGVSTGVWPGAWLAAGAPAIFLAASGLIGAMPSRCR